MIIKALGFLFFPITCGKNKKGQAKKRRKNSLLNSIWEDIK